MDAAETRKAHEVKIKWPFIMSSGGFFFDRFFDVASEKVRHVRKDINCEKGS